MEDTSRSPDPSLFKAALDGVGQHAHLFEWMLNQKDTATKDQWLANSLGGSARQNIPVEQLRAIKGVVVLADRRGLPASNTSFKAEGKP